MTDEANIKPFQIGGVTFGDGRLTIIAGPCVIVSDEHALMMARECARRGARLRL
jgi:3-deoxy-D-arabino-heptulosonate 7-phosphate (DAHP) synthase